MIARDPVWLGGEPCLLLSAHGFLSPRWAGGEPAVLHAALYVETLGAVSFVDRSTAADSSVARSRAVDSTMERGMSAEVLL